MFHRESECYVCAEGSFADDEGMLKSENECCTAPEESQTDGDEVRLLHLANEFAEGSSANGREYRDIMIKHSAWLMHAADKPSCMTVTVSYHPPV